MAESPVDEYISQARRAQAEADPDDLVTRHLMLAVKYARRYRYRGVEFSELLAEANLALVQAAHDWPASKAKAAGIPFKRYAARVIGRGLVDAIRKAGSPLAVPPKVRAAAAAVQDATARLYREYEAAGQPHREPTYEEIARLTGLTVEQVRAAHMVLRSRFTVPLDAPADPDDPDGGTRGDDLADPDLDLEEQVADAIDRAETIRTVREALARLRPKAQRVVSLALGIETPAAAEMTFEEVLHAFRHLHGYQHYGRKLKEVLKGEHRVEQPAPRLGGRHRRSSLHGGYAPLPFESSRREERVADLWRSLSRRLPPALVAPSYQPPGTVCAGE